MRKTTAEMLQVSQRMVERVLEESSTDADHTDERHDENKQQRQRKLESFDKDVIRKIVHDLYIYFLSGEILEKKNILIHIRYFELKFDKTFEKVRTTILKILVTGCAINMYNPHRIHYFKCSFSDTSHSMTCKHLVTNWSMLE